MELDLYKNKMWKRDNGRRPPPRPLLHVQNLFRADKTI